MTIFHLLAYVTVLVFIIAVTVRAVRIARMPIHLRWELYPLPHEKGRAHYGGSILEEVDWWTKPKHKDHIGEMRAMAAEILFLKGIWEHNRKLWVGSFPLHFGLYLLIGNTALVILNSLLALGGVEMGILPRAINAIGWIGCVLGAIGAVIMLFQRIFDPGLSKFSTPSHYLNLFMLGGIYVSGMVWMANDVAWVTHSSGFLAGLIYPSVMPNLPISAHWFIMFTLVFMFYLPFTHMTHFFTKYFTYHCVRWEDETNRPGDPMQKKIDPQLQQTVTWAADHVGADGHKNWVDIATSPVPKKEKEEV